MSRFSGFAPAALAALVVTATAGIAPARAGTESAPPATASVATTAPATTAPAGAIIGPALHVSDVEAAKRFYVDALGMRVNRVMGAATNRETILGFDADPSKPGLILLFDETAAQHPKIGQSNGYDRLVLRIVDLDACASRLSAAGFAHSAIRDVAQGYRMMVATDPDGYKLELVERRMTR